MESKWKNLINKVNIKYNIHMNIYNYMSIKEILKILKILKWIKMNKYNM